MALSVMEPEGLEPSTSPMPTERSPLELRSRDLDGAQAGARDRTGDLFLTREALCPLSYDGMESKRG